VYDLIRVRLESPTSGCRPPVSGMQEFRMAGDVGSREVQFSSDVQLLKDKRKSSLA